MGIIEQAMLVIKSIIDMQEDAMSKVKRVYVEKKPEYAVKAKELFDEMTEYLNIKAKKVRVLIRYDIENLSDKTYEKALKTVFSEPTVDFVY